MRSSLLDIIASVTESAGESAGANLPPKGSDQTPSRSNPQAGKSYAPKGEQRRELVTTALLGKTAISKLAERGLRIYGQTRKEAMELIKKIITLEGLQQMGYFLQIVHLIIDSQEFEFLASVKYKNSYREDDMNRFNEIYQFLLQNFRKNIMLSEVVS